jgi:hypothetical protein
MESPLHARRARLCMRTTNGRAGLVFPVCRIWETTSWALCCINVYVSELMQVWLESSLLHYLLNYSLLLLNLLLLCILSWTAGQGLHHHNPHLFACTSTIKALLLVTSLPPTQYYLYSSFLYLHNHLLLWSIAYFLTSPSNYSSTTASVSRPASCSNLLLDLDLVICSTMCYSDQQHTSSNSSNTRPAVLIYSTTPVP